MSVSDRIHLILADGTPQYHQLVKLVGKPSSSLIPSIPADEYVSGIDLDQLATPFQQRLAVYGDQPISTFNILA